jgi:DNA-binding transcriptional MerR regulator
MGNIIYTIKEFSQEIKVCEKTLRRWDESGKLQPAFRGKTNNYRYYSHNQLQQYFKEKFNIKII